MKHDLEDEWIIHAIGRSQWPSPPEALYHKIAVQTQGGRVPFVRLVSQKQIYAGFIFLMTMAFIVGGLCNSTPEKPSATAFYESDSGYEWINIMGRNV